MISLQTDLVLDALEQALWARGKPGAIQDTRKLEKVLNFDLPDWKDDFSTVAEEIIKEFKAA